MEQRRVGDPLTHRVAPQPTLGASVRPVRYDSSPTRSLPSDARSTRLPCPVGPGFVLDRFLVLEQIGQGGMGQIFSAYDPELDRKVAIKLIDESRDHRIQALQAQLRHEAQAMAALSHPNIVSIFDVGTVELPAERPLLYIAMELIEGQTLRDWLEAEVRSMDEILAVFMAAGRGLVAAHDVGLVHRDFKPSNVMLDHEGRARVMDFGLARVCTCVSGSEPSSTPDERVVSGSLTDFDGVVGTPAYMAPEQHIGGLVDERCDQYSFCASLWEALYGHRPFTGSTLDALADAKLHVEPTPRPGARAVPRGVRRILLRGLAPVADDRFASMVVLLGALRRQTASVHRRRRLGYGAAVVLSAGLAVLGYASDVGDLPCHGGPAKLVGVWDPSAQIEVQEAIQGTGVAYADDTWRRVRSVLDDYVERWSAAYTDACTATRVEQIQPEHVMDARMRCLDNRLQHVAALIKALATTDHQTIQRTALVVNHLPRIDACRDQHYANTELPLPDDPTMRDLITRLHKELIEAKALEKAGRYGEARERLLELEHHVEFVGYEPLRARVAMTSAWLRQLDGDLESAVALMSQAYFYAMTWNLDEVAARAAVALIYIIGFRQRRPQVALDQWASPAAAAVQRLGNEEVRALWLNNLGVIYSVQGEHEEALTHYHRALSIREQEFGLSSPITADTLYNLGIEHHDRGEYRQALEYYRRTLSIRERTLGSTHPYVALTAGQIGQFFAGHGEHERALEYYQQARRIHEQSSGPRALSTIESIRAIADLHRARGEYAQALEHYRRALSRSEALPDADEQLIAHCQQRIDEISLLREHQDAAAAPLERALTDTTGGRDVSSAEVRGAGPPWRPSG